VRFVFNPGNFETLKSNEALFLVREITFEALAWNYISLLVLYQ